MGSVPRNEEEKDGKPVKAHVKNRTNRNKSEKERRDKLNSYIRELAAMLPKRSSSPQKLDKAAILKSTVDFMKVHNDLTVSITGKDSSIFLNSNELGQLMFEGSHSLLFALTPCGIFTFLSESTQDALGYGKDELLGKNIFEYIFPADKLVLMRQLDNTIGTGRSLNGCNSFYLRFKTKLGNGDEDYVNVRCIGGLRSSKKQRCQEDPSTANYFVVLAEIVNLNFHRNTPTWVDDVVKFDSRQSLDGKFLFLDPRCISITGYLPYELLGSVMYDFVHSDDLDCVQKSFQSLFGCGEGTTDNYRILTKGCQWLHIKTTSYVSYNYWNSKPELICSTHELVSPPTDNIQEPNKLFTQSPNLQTLTAKDDTLGRFSPQLKQNTVLPGNLDCCEVSSKDIEKSYQLSNTSSYPKISPGKVKDESVNPYNYVKNEISTKRVVSNSSSVDIPERISPITEIISCAPNSYAVKPPLLPSSIPEMVAPEENSQKTISVVERFPRSSFESKFSLPGAKTSRSKVKTYKRFPQNNAPCQSTVRMNDQYPQSPSYNPILRNDIPLDLIQGYNVNSSTNAEIIASNVKITGFGDAQTILLEQLVKKQTQLQDIIKKQQRQLTQIDRQICTNAQAQLSLREITDIEASEQLQRQAQVLELDRQQQEIRQTDLYYRLGQKINPVNTTVRTIEDGECSEGMFSTATTTCFSEYNTTPSTCNTEQTSQLSQQWLPNPQWEQGPVFVSSNMSMGNITSPMRSSLSTVTSSSTAVTTSVTPTRDTILQMTKFSPVSQCSVVTRATQATNTSADPTSLENDSQNRPVDYFSKFDPNELQTFLSSRPQEGSDATEDTSLPKQQQQQQEVRPTYNTLLMQQKQLLDIQEEQRRVLVMRQEEQLLRIQRQQNEIMMQQSVQPPQQDSLGRHDGEQNDEASSYELTEDDECVVNMLLAENSDLTFWTESLFETPTSSKEHPS